MIDLGNELDGYGEYDKNQDVSTCFNTTIPEATGKPTYTISKHSIGRLADLQKGGFNTVAPPKYRAYRAIGQFNDMVNHLITNAMTPDEIRAREKDE